MASSIFLQNIVSQIWFGEKVLDFCEDCCVNYCDSDVCTHSSDYLCKNGIVWDW